MKGTRGGPREITFLKYVPNVLAVFFVFSPLAALFPSDAQALSVHQDRYQLIHAHQAHAAATVRLCQLPGEVVQH